MTDNERKYTILVVPGRPGRPLRVELGVTALRRLAVFAGFAALGLGIGLVDYVHVRMSFVLSQRREEKLRRAVEVSQKDAAESGKERDELREELQRLQPGVDTRVAPAQSPPSSAGASLGAGADAARGGEGERLALNKDAGAASGFPLAHRPRSWPLKGVITSDFGVRSSPFNGGAAQHNGLDIAAPEGTQVVSSGSGTVTFAGDKQDLGLYLIIDHGAGFSTHYGHLASLLVNTGDAVTALQPIGQVGMTGRTTGPHLHFEVRFMDIPIDPRPYLPPDPGISTSLAQGP